MNHVKFDGLMKRIAEDTGHNPSLIKGPTSASRPREKVHVYTSTGTYEMDMSCFPLDYRSYNQGSLIMDHYSDKNHKAMRQSLTVARRGFNRVVNLEEVCHNTFLSVAENGEYNIIPIEELSLDGVSGQIKKILAY